MKDINNFIKLEENDSFSKLRGSDLQELLIQISEFNLTYRETLNLPKRLTFGIEIEYEGIISTFVNFFIKRKFPEWDSRKDLSLKFGGEIVSDILNDDIETWKKLKTICIYLKKKNAITNKNAGGHIHVGTKIFKNNLDSWKIFIKTYLLYENVIFRFGYGDKISARKDILEYAPPCGKELYRKIEKLYEAEKIVDLIGYIPTDKYLALNFSNIRFFQKWSSFYTKNTLELRCPNATDEEIIWQNNINMFTKLILSSTKGTIDENFIEYKIKNINPELFNNLYLYNEVNLKEALEFVDLIFDNNLDKIYFLKQYLKDFQNNYGCKSAIKAKKK